MSQPYAYPGPPRPGTPPPGPPPAGPYAYPAPLPSGPYAYPGPSGYSGFPVTTLAPVAQILPRPAAVTMAATMVVTASLQWICGLSFVWLMAVTGMSEFPNQRLGADSAIYHLLRSFHLRMLDGLAAPLYLIPLAAFVLGFLILVPRPWTRWALTLLGVGALAWSGWWLHRQFVWWLVPAFYILVACLIVWTPGASAWYRARGRPVSS